MNEQMKMDSVMIDLNVLRGNPEGEPKIG